MKKLLYSVALASLLLGVTTLQSNAVVTVIQKNVQVPTSGTLTPFDFFSDGTNSWPPYNLFDGTTAGSFNADGGFNMHVINGTTAIGNNTDGVAATANGISPVDNYNYVFDGTTWDRWRGSAVTSGVGLTNTPSPYPDGAVPITATNTGTTAATSATLANVAGKTTYLCGFSVRSNATAAATGNITVTGTKTGTLNFTHWTAPLASGLGVSEPPISPCIPASAVTTSIVINAPAAGAGGVVSVSAWGYTL